MFKFQAAKEKDYLLYIFISECKTSMKAKLDGYEHGHEELIDKSVEDGMLKNYKRLIIHT